MNNNKTVYVIGHKNPDTDSIAAAIAYANLKNLTGHHNYVAARCGNVSSETQYVLDRFGLKAPKFVGDVEHRFAIWICVIVQEYLKRFRLRMPGR